ncbi:uncharacterized protein [Onthophagus taurus]|uniref:uncharacterized protein n=1 Tax=Onthophagus taurus TaxID=166361 RepID=UPI0039BE95A8
MSTVLNPLYNLLKKNVKFHWDENCDKAFSHVKEILKSTEVLVHFNPDLELKLTVDASSVGIGAVLSHRFPSGIEKPIAFVSRTLTDAEKNYSQIEREGSAIIYGVTKFNQYLCGYKFTLVTDHKPLLITFGENKAIPQLSANRLRRWALILAAYNYKIEYVKSNLNCTDWLSWLPVREDDFVTGAYTKWVGIFPMSNIASTLQLISLVSDEFEMFLKKNNIKHLTSPPYHPSSNSAAENVVKTVKNLLKKSLLNNTDGDLNCLLCRFLFDYRNTPHCTTGVSPAILMFGCSLRTRFSSFLPFTNNENEFCNKDINDVAEKVKRVKEKQVKYSNGKNYTKFEIDKIILVKNYAIVNKPDFIKGKIVKVIGNRTYLVEIPELQKKWKRHTNQIRKFTFVESRIPFDSSGSSNNNNESKDPSSENSCNNESAETLVTNRPKRMIKPVDRLCYE